jgi:hypothetical protein
MNEEFVFLKLLNGEQLMAIKREEDKESITIEFPMQIRLFPRLEESGLVEQITSGPYCQFTEDRIFTFSKKDILFAKRLHELMVPHYHRMLQEHESEVEVDKIQAEEGNLESEEDVNYIAEAVERLHDVFERARKRQEDNESEERTFTIVPGNDTKH